jgi:hypothetical protein
LSILKLKVGPTIRVENKRLVINEGERVQFKCTGEGHPLPEIKWLVGDTFIYSHRTNYTSEYSKEIWLIFDYVSKTNNGSYTCYYNESIKETIDLIVNCN